MLVTKLEVFTVKVNARGNWILVRLSTDTGITGIGEASHGGRDDRTLAMLHKLFPVIQGRSIFDLEPLRQAGRTLVPESGTTAAAAMSSLEQCLWDLTGKALGVPVYALFGGALRRSVRQYANINRSAQRTSAGFASIAEKAVAAGFDAVKLAPFDEMPRSAADADAERYTRQGIERATAVRAAIGPRRHLLVDAHSRFTLTRGLDLARRLEPLDLFWLEEVTPPADLPAINRAAKMPTAGGETVFGVDGFFRYIRSGAVDIVMPDVKYCGGMLELKKIFGVAEAAGVPVSPHGPASPVGNCAAAHLGAGAPNFLILEHSFGEVPWRAELIEPPEDLERGSLVLSERPGLGIALNEKTAQRYAA